MNYNDNIKFDQLPAVDDIAGVLEDIFSVKLDISGGWAYDNNSALKVNSLTIPLEQFLHTFASMRANIEMNLTQDEKNRYAGINVNQIEHKEFEIENKQYDLVTFKVTAIKEENYNNFIQEYKDNYGKESFDLKEHFENRNKATIEIHSDFWFIFNF
jgi:hypothetical protein